LMQIIIWAIIGITSIKIGYISNILGWVIDLHIYSFNFLGLEIFLVPLIFTIIWYVFIFNAINWSDWIRGNTTGLSMISFSILFILWIILFNNDNYEAWVENAYFIMKISLILVWIILPFWYFDIKNKMLMWDSGTMFLGFMLASLAIIAGWKIATVLVVFGIYSVDAIYVILKRLQNKKNPLQWDFTHLHHRLLKAWFTEKQVLTFVYSLSLIFWISALFLDKIWKIIVFILIIVIVVFINRIKKVKFKK
jgi:UDP-GlcNAc:undecaprenyl-phosphate GlcNAc-1-phosphate transferase